jgi:hypothetical protein
VVGAPKKPWEDRPDVPLPSANKTCYRVVAVGADGSESGASDYTGVPRPFVFSRLETTAWVGISYR